MLLLPGWAGGVCVLEGGASGASLHRGLERGVKKIEADIAGTLRQGAVGAGRAGAGQKVS